MKSKAAHIKIISALFLIVMGALMGCKTPSANSNNKATSYGVSGTITRTDAYCGGARPSEEMLEKLRSPHAAANIIVLARSGNTNVLGGPVLFRDTTDAEGKFQLNLPKGDYCLVLFEKEKERNKNFFTQEFYQIDQNCDANWLKQCDLTFTVNDRNVEGLQLSLQKRCFLNTWSPCVQYTGPLPP